MYTPQVGDQLEVLIDNPWGARVKKGDIVIVYQLTNYHNHILMDVRDSRGGAWGFFNTNDDGRGQVYTGIPEPCFRVISSKVSVSDPPGQVEKVEDPHAGMIYNEYLNKWVWL